MVFLLASCFSLVAALTVAGALLWGGEARLLEVILWAGAGSQIAFDLFLDWASCAFLMSVFLISGSIYVYSHSYMEGEAFALRFVLLLSLFVFSMVLLIVSPSMISMLGAWDGLGLSSYFLVIYYQSAKVEGAAMVTALSNRVGDVFMIVALILCLSQGLTALSGKSSMDLVAGGSLALVLSLAAITKSAQFPYCTWLPAAMAAPTPVSSLVHSSTLVTAGVYLLVRFHLVANSESLAMLGLVCSFTLIIATLAAITCMDFKKTVALSTLSQLAFMGVAYSLGFVHYCFFHLLTHAMFKSCLFMGAGGMIHLGYSSQDFRSLDCSTKASSSASVVALSSMTLAGVPLLAGYFSKELILLSAWSSNGGLLLAVICVAGALGTGVYTARSVTWVMSSEKTKSLLSANSDWVLVLSSALVLALSAVSGWWLTGASLEGGAQSGSLVIVVFIGLLSTWAFVSFTSSHKPKGLVLGCLNSFLFLAPLTLVVTPANTLSASGKCGLHWEQGWSETVGPLAISGLIKHYSLWALKAESLVYKSVMGLALLTGFIFIWMLKAKGP